MHALEVIATPTDSHPLTGRRFEVSERLQLGRGSASDVQIVEPSIARLHCRFTVERGRLRVEDLASTNGTFVNGVSVNTAELQPGDFVELPGGVVLRVAGAPELGLPGDALQRELEQRPDDDGLWRVWSDRLLEHGHPLGAHIALGAAAGKSEHARALGPLATSFITGALEVTWRHGFVERAVLRSVDQWFSGPWLRPLKLLLAHPLAHFLRAVEIDALSYARSTQGGALQTIEAEICESLELISQSGLNVLEQVRFGPSPQPLWSPRLATAWRRCVDAMPRLSHVGPIWVARAAWLQLLSTPRGVGVKGLDVGAQWPLKEEQANLIGPLDDCAFALDAPDDSPSHGVGLRVDRELGLWWATDIVAEQHGYTRGEPRLHVNGRECIRHRLRPNDVLEPAPGLSFRFVME